MTEKHESNIISRRRTFAILGLGALSLVVAPTVLTVSDAKAQQPDATQTPKTSTTNTQTHETGTQRRHERREARREHRHEGGTVGQKPTKPTGQQ
jgi:hypothetical protein